MTGGDRNQDGSVTKGAARHHRKWQPARRVIALIAASALLAAPAAAASDGSTPAPGTLLRSQPLGFQGLTRPAQGTVGWRVEYASTSVLGQPRVVSGAVLVDRDRIAAPRGVVGLAPGGHGLADKCAPSNLLRGGAEPELGTIDALTKAGFVVALTDYEGLGTPGEHPFGVNLAAGRNVLDVVRAARQLGESGASASLPVGLYGYSQGGGAVGSALEQLPAYAPELPVSGAVVGGALANPYAVARGVDGTVWSGLAHAAMLGFDDAYGLGLYGDLNAWGRHLMKATKRSCIDLLAPVMLTRLEWMFKRPTLTRPDWRARAGENALGGAAAAAPVYQFHGTWDQFMSYRDARKLRVAWCERGSQVRFQPANLSEHFATEKLMRPRAVAWLDERMRGRPDPGNC